MTCKVCLLWTECGCRREGIDPQEFYVDNSCTNSGDCQYEGCESWHGDSGLEAPYCAGLGDGGGDEGPPACIAECVMAQQPATKLSQVR